ncbi:mechanosensitive ion channel [Candidatus Thorarchaeota archaeon]|nr:MAG: mechanosensitive ion channel [Candidatus Thorarchaeota archaeon]
MQILEFLEDPIGFIISNLSLVQPFLLLAAELIILLIIYAISTRGISRRLRQYGLSGEARTGIVIVFRLLFVVVAAILIVNSFGPDLGTLVSFSTLIGAAIGLAVAQAVSGMVTGLYILIARPFRVGDYVRIGQDEGIVTGITLNYTKILKPDETRLRIPNTKIVNSDIVNFRVELKDVIKDVAHDRFKTKEVEERRLLTTALAKLKGITHTEIAYRYTFDLTLNFQFDHLRARDNFDEICEEWADTFVGAPTWQVWDTTNQAIIYKFTVLADEPQDLIEYISDFMDQLLFIYRHPPSAEKHEHTEEELEADEESMRAPE